MNSRKKHIKSDQERIKMLKQVQHDRPWNTEINVFRSRRRIVLSCAENKISPFHVGWKRKPISYSLLTINYSLLTVFRQLKNVKNYPACSTSLSCLFIVLFCTMGLKANAKAAPDYYKQKIQIRKLNEKQWKDLTKNLDYKDYSTKHKQQEHFHEGENLAPHGGSFSFGSPIITWLFYIIGISLLVFIIYRLVRGNMGSINKNINAQTDAGPEEDHETDISSDLERMLKDAIENKLYRQAVRLYYLIIIRELTAHQLIHWKKDKTNKEYLTEMSSHPDFMVFKEITRMFELIWYGENNIDENNYRHISERFGYFQQKIKQR